MHRNFKIVLLGDGEVGKTTWMYRLLSDRFENNYVPTVGFEVHPLKYVTGGGDSICFDIWDIAGVEHLGGLRPGYYLEAKGAILMCDLTKRETYTSLTRWQRDLTRICGSIPIVVCGNKADRGDRIAHLAAERTDFCEMRVASGYNLEEPLLLLARKLLRREDIEGLVNFV